MGPGMRQIVEIRYRRNPWGRLRLESKLGKQLQQAAKERKARTFSEAMPGMVAAPGMGAFTFIEHNVDSVRARPTIAAKWRLRAGTPFVSL